MSGFSISYEVITSASAEDGDAADRGFLVEDVTFREAMDELRWCRGAYVQADTYAGARVHRPRWFTFYNADEDYSTGAITNYSLHLPERITDASRLRIARLLGCYGAK